MHFAGFLDYLDPDLGAYYEAADVFVFVGRHEPMGFALVEACAFCLPVITSTEVGAAHDYVRDQVNGWVIKSSERDKLVEAMKMLAGNKELRQRMGRASGESIRAVEARLSSFEEAVVETTREAMRCV